ncbi:hypothetical protein ACQCSX_16335 [Pseudarthrobacter sp. P1]|uniref:hypothetical protein n=1 Tax=Pseudarthrobacter sp. P1 TaxID=3418418 RepID=UPI003CEB543A
MKRKRQTPLRALLAGLALILTALSIVVPASSAAAYHEVTTGNWPGSVVGYQAQGLHYDACGGYPSVCFNPQIWVPAPYAYRSPASNGAQTVTFLTTLSSWNGTGWVQIANRSASLPLADGQPGLYLQTSDFKIYGKGSFQIATIVEWRDAWTAQVYGTRVLAYDQAGDYTCVGRFTAFCDATAGYVYLRSPM